MSEELYPSDYTNEAESAKTDNSEVVATAGEKKPRKGHVRVPMSLVYDERLSAASKLVYTVLRSHVNRDGYAWPGLRTLRSEAGIGFKRLKASIKELQNEGYIVVTTGRGHATSRYFFSEFSVTRLTPQRVQKGTVRGVNNQWSEGADGYTKLYPQTNLNNYSESLSEETITATPSEPEPLTIDSGLSTWIKSGNLGISQPFRLLTLEGDTVRVGFYWRQYEPPAGLLAHIQLRYPQVQKVEVVK